MIRAGSEFRLASFSGSHSDLRLIRKVCSDGITGRGSVRVRAKPPTFSLHSKEEIS
jgi:hypothetical protein